jgi:hypothetical protein
MPSSRGRPANRQPKPKEVSGERKPALTECPETPLRPAIPAGSAKGVRWRSLDVAANWFFRILTLMSVGYLVFDRLYETSVTVSAPVPNALKAVAFPFAITNNSHLFAVKNVEWQCIAAHLMTDTREPVENTTLVSGSTTEIRPGETINVNCNRPHTPRGTGQIIGTTGQLVEGRMVIRVRYNVKIFGVFSWTRYPAPTEFNLFTDGTPPRWIRGRFAE